MIHLLAISGSLRKISSNTTLLNATSLLAPADVTITLYDNIGKLPHFNPDLEGNEPQPVTDFRKQVTEAQGIIICSPEYAHGVPGAMKNALDWLVSCIGFINKPVMLLNASSRGTYAQASLTETLSVMTAQIVPDASIAVSLWGKDLDAAGIAANTELARRITDALTVFRKFVSENQ